MNASSSSVSRAAPPVGWAIKNNAGKKKVVLELGGNSGVIVHSDADLAYAADRCVTGGFAYAGQSCISVQRILVEHSVYGKFTELFLAGVSKLKVGDPLGESSDLGPLIRESDAIRAAEWVQEAVRGGARLLCGGKHKGSAVRANCADQHQAQHESELPGNFCAGGDGRALQRFRLGAEAGQQFRVWIAGWAFHSRRQTIFQAYDELEVGGLIAGDVPTFRIDHMPYGGIKDSGLGREGLRDAIQEMTEPKLLVMNLR